MTHTRAAISKKQLQKELGVTYKTAWRIHNSIKILMEQNHGDLLFDPSAYTQNEYKERKWLFFNKLEIKVVHKQEPSDEEEEE